MKLIKEMFKQNFLKVLVLSLVFTSAFARNNFNNDAPKHKTFVLVHGAWQAAFVWDEVKAQLEKQGHHVIAVELQGHGKDQSALADATLDNYVAKVTAAINSADGKVILVGHSLGGAIITQTATKVPGKIEKLVYIAGFVPPTGKSLNDLAKQDPNPGITPELLVLPPDYSTVTFANPEVNIPELFLKDGSKQQKELLVKNLKPEPTAPMGTPLQYDPKVFAGLDKYYVYTTQDRAISYVAQQQMVKAAGITKTFSIEASHSPFVSKPAEVVTILLNLTK